MSLRNLTFDQDNQQPQGVDSTTPVAKMQDGYVRQGSNLFINLFGGYTKRNGYVNLATTPWAGRSITAGIQYESSVGILSTIIFGTDGTNTGGIIGSFAPGAVTPISSGLSGTVRPYFVQFKERLFFFNGVDSPILYDGAAPRQVGITAPTIAPSKNAAAAGGFLVPLASYVWAYTYFNSVTGAESTPSPLFTYVLGAGETQVTLNITAGSATTADTIKVYRTDGNGNTLFLDGTTSIVSTTYVSSKLDAGLGQQIEFDNTRITDLSSTAQFPTVADNRIFVRTGDNEIRFSKLGQNGPMPESYELKAFVPTVGRFGVHDKIVGINRINQLPIVLKESSIGRLDPIGLPNSTISFDNVSYQYREITDAVGGICHGGAEQVYGELVFVAKDNVYATDGISVRPIALPIQTTIKAMGVTNTQKMRISAINDKDNRRVYFSIFSSPSALHPSVVLVGDYQLYPNFRWTVFEPGTNTTTHPGITAACFFHEKNVTTGRLDVYFGNEVLNGKLYNMNTGTNDDGHAIYMKLVTRPYYGPSPLLWKLYKKAELRASGNGSPYNMVVGAIYNLSAFEEELQNLSLFANGALWDDAGSLWDSSFWADNAIIEEQYYMHRKAKYMQMVVYQTEADHPLDLYTWGIYESVFGGDEGPQEG